MLKRDSLTAQMQQLSHTLAKVKRLIEERQETQALSTLQEVFGEYFGTNITDLLETPANVFIQRFKKEDLKPEALGLLADFLDALADVSDDASDRRAIWEKVVLIYDTLEQEHKVVSFAHIARRSAILAQLDSQS
ncbi:hypothetical protein GCM10011386_25880 [Parapedobacter defluvii]|uniref:Uncharacterized protein n=1 Tax=Parapedobacter defluvii TaxID=2045106 RepID=A0ABQ1LZJ3_9SPHI|nr:hypothetical protein [Parapedobacter defluvii]GGC32548.1 hypothetical protein GCM10011386_25880 [Parapedobacter defluvii]